MMAIVGMVVRVELLLIVILSNYGRTVAEAVTEDVLQQFLVCHEAGLPDFAFMRRCRSKGRAPQRFVIFVTYLVPDECNFRGSASEFVKI